MPEPAPRKFTMADLMILIAGCAVGIAWTQVGYRDVIDQSREIDLGWSIRLSYLAMSPTPILASISVALLVCRLRRPRPNFRRLFRRPGAVATAGVSLLLAFDGAMELAGRGLNLVVKRIWPPTPGFSITLGQSFSLSMLGMATEAGTVIAACWLLLFAVGRWRPEPTWVDRSGRCLGACWIAVDIATRLTQSLIA